ncbi:MAG: SMP-30/gluconolactonase/LRE family protein [Phycisphaerales bacterium]|nr:SMP-30/gluconolactonase/LRE family protein [Phycisphaerales bacterium]
MSARVIARYGSALACLASALAAGCASTPKSTQAPLFFPAPPEKPRVQFLMWASGADQVEPGRGGFEQFVLGDEPVVQRAINKPYGVAVHDGVAYVCDTKGLSICRLDFKNGTYGVMGVRGPGRVRKPINIAVDPLGYKFVADSVRNQVVVYGPTDEYVAAFDVPTPCHVVDVAVYGEELFVLDNDETCQIVVLNRANGDVIRTIGGPGGEPGQFKIPNSLCVSPDGFLYVSDTHNWRIQKLKLDGTPVWTKGTPGYRLGQFGRPRGIRVGPDNIIYVVDGATEIVQLFDDEGNILMRFGGPGDMAGALGLPSSLAIDKSSVPYFKKYAHKDFNIDYLLFVISQYGPRLVNVYAFGSFPEGYRFSESEIATLPRISVDEGIGPVEGSDVAADPAQLREERSDNE